MMRWLVGYVSVSACVLALPAHAQVPQTPPPASGTFPTDAPAPLPPPPPAGPPAPSPSPAPAEAPVDLEGTVVAPAPPPVASQPTPAPAPPTRPPELDLRSNRERRPFFIGGELGWNGMAGLGVNFSYHVVPHLALDTGAGVSITGLRAGFRVRGNLLTGEWTPFVAAGMSYATGSSGQDVEGEVKGEKAKLRVLPSPFLQLAAGVNYTGVEGFVFTATTGYSVLLRDHNTTYRSGSVEAYDDLKEWYGGGMIISVAFGYAF